jgi:hypothetical protein
LRATTNRPYRARRDALAVEMTRDQIDDATKRAHRWADFTSSSGRECA